MSDPRKSCGKCGRALERTSPQGLCPGCLLSRALVSDIEEEIAADETQRVGDYDLLQRIGRGGMGVVYRARHRTLNRIVALKLISAGELAAPDFVERFRIEAEAAASLDHPNIVPIYEIGADRDRHFFSMKLVEGGTLGDRLSKGQRPGSNEEAARLMVRLAHAVHYAHQRGVLHRDIKPDNVLLDTTGEPLLMDFGLAKLIERDTHITRTLAVLGTPAYISPEQAAGSGTPVTTATDVHGLGTVLYELLTGQPPFGGGSTAATIRQVLEQEPERPARCNPTVHRDLETICLKCLEKNPARRYSSALALAEDLERWLRHEPITARATTPVERAVKWARRHPAYAALIAVVAMALVSIAVISNVSRTRVKAALEISENQKTQIQRQQSELAERQAVTVRQLSRSLFLQGVQYADANQTGSALAYWAQALRLDSANHAAGARIFHTLTRHRFVHPAFAPMENHGFANMVRFSPDGSRLAIASRGSQAQAWIRNGTNGTLLHSWELGDLGAHIQFSPDGRRVVTGAGILGHAHGAVRVWDAFTGSASGPEIALPDGPSQVLFSPDGSALAVSAVGVLRVFDAEGTNERFAAGPQGPNALRILQCEWSSDSKHLVAVSLDQNVRWLDAVTGTVVEKWKASSPIGSFALSPAGNLIATSHKAHIDVHEARSGHTVVRLENAPRLRHLTFSPDQQHLLSCGEDGRIRLWSLADGTSITTMNAGAPQLQALFSPDGKRVISHGREATARIWDMATFLPWCEPIRQADLLLDTSLDASGERLVTSAFDGTVVVWNLATPPASELRIAAGAEVKRFQFSHSGKLLAIKSRDKEVQVWNCQSGNWISDLPRTQGVLEMQFDGDERLLAADPRRVQAFNPTTGVALDTPSHESPASLSAFSPDGKLIAAVGSDRVVRIWNLGTGEWHGNPIPHPDALFRGITFSPNGRRLATFINDPWLRVWDSDTGALLWQARQDNWPAAVTYTHGGRRLLCRAGFRLRFFDAESGKELGPTLQSAAQFSEAIVSENGARIVAASLDNIVRVFDGATGASLVEPVAQGSTIRALAINSRGTRFATGTADGRVSVFDMETGRSLTGPLWHDEIKRFDSNLDVRHVGFTPDGRQLVSAASDGTVRLWDMGPADSDPIPSWLPSLAEAVSGLRVKTSPDATTFDSMQLEAVPYAEGQSTRTQLAALPSTNDWNQLPRWFYAPVEKRATSPLLQKD